MYVTSTLSSKRPGGKGKGLSNLPFAQSSAPVQNPRYRNQQPRSRGPSPSRTEELCPEDWLDTAARQAEIDELDEIIAKMENKQCVS